MRTKRKTRTKTTTTGARSRKTTEPRGGSGLRAATAAAASEDRDLPAAAIVTNAQIAGLFDELADLLDIEGANPFRVIAYRNAARTIREHSQSMADLLAANVDLDELPGIGKDLAEKIATVVRTGRLPLLDEVAARTPRVLSELLRIAGLGPKRVKILYRELDVRSVDDLRRAAEAGRLRGLRGFGQKTEESILHGIERLAAQRRLPLPAAEAVASRLAAYLERCAGIGSVTVAGSFRRRKETVGDLDVLVTAASGARAMRHFAAYPETEEVLAHGGTRSTLRLTSGLQVDLRVVPEASYGAALHYFTGSKAHNVAVRTLALKRGFKLNEYGVFRGARRVAGRTEEEVFAKAGLPYIEPELRENRGEIEAAAAGRLPSLVRVDCLRGDLHCETDSGDGRDPLEAMVQAAAERGYEYIAIADRVRRAGFDAGRLRAQLRAIDALNARSGKVAVLKAAEVSILGDGSLDLPDALLQALDFAICTVHDPLGYGETRQTERVLRAMDHPRCTILGRPAGRAAPGGPPYTLNLERVLRGAVERGCVVEVAAWGERHDLSDEGCRLAYELGARVALASGARAAGELPAVRYAVDQARRGWLAAANVLNALPLAELRVALERRR